jgi:hypothetical protein
MAFRMTWDFSDGVMLYHASADDDIPAAAEGRR